MLKGAEGAIDLTAGNLFRRLLALCVAVAAAAYTR